MAFETALFGDGVSTTRVTDVHTYFGSRDSGKTAGKAKTEGFVTELTIDIDGDMVSAAAYPLIAPEILANSIIEDVYLEVTEVFVLGGTTPAIEVGTETSEATNGFTITEAQAEAAGIYDLTSALSGTWAAGLAADTTVGLALSGTTPTVTSAGKARVVIRYISV
jgi:hypothetical protein